jgi:hypothetical protein
MCSAHEHEHSSWNVANGINHMETMETMCSGVFDTIPPDSAPVITTSLSSLIKVPPTLLWDTVCYFIHLLCDRLEDLKCTMSQAQLSLPASLDPPTQAWVLFISAHRS